MTPSPQPDKEILSEKKKRLLEQRLRRIGEPNAVASRPSIQPRPSNSKPLASLGQARIWVLSDLSEHSPSYNITSSFIVESNVNVAAISFALNRIVARHETLRSSYRLEGGEVVQYTEPSLVLDVTQESLKDQESCFAAAQAFGRRSFDIESGPLLRLGLFSTCKTYHVLILSVHDIVFDKWSLKVFWKEFSAYYRENVTGVKAELDPLPIEFSDFSFWQRKWLKDGEEERQLTYWRKKLQDPPSPIPLPTDRPYPKQVTDPGSIERFTLPRTTARNIREFSKRHNVSLFTTFLLGYAILLGRYSDTEDLLISSPVANRRKKETAELISFLLNTLVIRVDLSGNPTVAEALDRLKHTVLEALDYQDLPTDAIFDAIKPSRTQGRHPLFQTMFVFQREDEGMPKLELENCEVQPTFVETKTSKFDISLFVAESGDSFEVIAEYRTDIFNTDTIKRLLAHYGKLVEGLSVAPNQCLGELDILTPSEYTSLLPRGICEFSGEPTPLIDRILDQSTVKGESLALITKNEELTYRALTERVKALARKLVELKETPTSPIAIYAERSVEAVIGLLAIQASGSPYVPLDPTYPKNRTLYIINDVKPSVILTASKLRDEIEEFTKSIVVTFDEIGSTNTVLPQVSSNSLAYLIYTSGSTGSPKGVEITHRSLSLSTLARTDFYGFDPSRFLLLSSLCFDSSVAGLFWSLSTGGTLAVLPPGDERDPLAIRDAAGFLQPDVLLTIPSLYREILLEEPDKLKSLNHVIVAGESCPHSLVSLHYNTLENCQLFNEYGPTEATVWCTATPLQASLPVTLGRPIPNYEVIILSPSLRAQPVGVPGEICVCGPGLAQGYLNDPERTRIQFPNIYLPDGRRIRVYKTGDRGRILSNGNLEFLGRIDSQLKINGFRFEPAETESALQKVEGVREALVKLSDNKGVARLVAYLLVEPSYRFNKEEMVKILQSDIPKHAVPTHYILLSDFPRLPNGKIDHHLLPTPTEERSYDSERILPATPTEEKLLKIWSEVLGDESISTHDDFFELGGNSLQAIRIFSRIRSEFETRISSSRLIQAPTLSELASLIDKEREPRNFKCLVSFRTSGELPPIFLIHSGGLQVLFYKDLVRHLDERIPLYGLQAVGFDGAEAPLKSIREMATLYLKEVETVYPNGPYVFLGHCFGVTIALEMSRRLIERGKNVPLVVSIDGAAPLPTGFQRPPKPKKFPNLPPVIREFRVLIRNTRRYTRKTIEVLKSEFLLRFGSENVKESIRAIRVIRAVGFAFNHYRAGEYPYPVLALRCIDSENYAYHSDEDWKRSAPNMEMHQIPCSHDEILIEPYVKETAEKINRKLASLTVYESIRSRYDSR